MLTKKKNMPANETDRSIHVLWCDDNPDSLGSIVKGFQSLGVHMVTASSWDEAVDLAKRNSFHVLMMDYRFKLPDGTYEDSGPSYARQAAEIWPDMLRVLVTEYFGTYLESLKDHDMHHFGFYLGKDKLQTAKNRRHYRDEFERLVFPDSRRHLENRLGYVESMEEEAAMIALLPDEEHGEEDYYAMDTGFLQRIGLGEPGDAFRFRVTEDAYDDVEGRIIVSIRRVPAEPRSAKAQPVVADLDLTIFPEKEDA